MSISYHMHPQSSGELLAGWVREQIQAYGPVTLARFIEWSLYHPDYGYYSRGPNIGPGGDFLTSPETSVAFGQLLAVHVSEIDALLNHPTAFNIIECGPGQGTLALDLLYALREGDPDLYARCRYWLVEISPALRRMQQERLQPEHESRVAWATGVDQLPHTLEGTIVGNEFVDAFPVHVVENRNGSVVEQYVSVGEDGTFNLTFGDLSDQRLADFLEQYNIQLAPGERIEIDLSVDAWAHDAGRVLTRGVVTLIDYGDTQPNRYSAPRREGTLLGYYGGAVTHDVLAHPGEQDITALVDFTALQDWASAAGFSVLGMTRQAQFLVGLGLGTTFPMEGQGTDVTASLNYRRGLQTLISLEGLGRFHVLLLGKGIDVVSASKRLSGLKYAGIF